jgi:hypothetical protein
VAGEAEDRLWARNVVTAVLSVSGEVKMGAPYSGMEVDVLVTGVIVSLYVGGDKRAIVVGGRIYWVVRQVTEEKFV